MWFIRSIHLHIFNNIKFASHIDILLFVSAYSVHFTAYFKYVLWCYQYIHMYIYNNTYTVTCIVFYHLLSYMTIIVVYVDVFFNDFDNYISYSVFEILVNGCLLKTCTISSDLNNIDIYLYQSCKAWLLPMLMMLNEFSI